MGPWCEPMGLAYGEGSGEQLPGFLRQTPAGCRVPSQSIQLAFHSAREVLLPGRVIHSPSCKALGRVAEFGRKRPRSSWRSCGIEENSILPASQFSRSNRGLDRRLVSRI